MSEATTDFGPGDPVHYVSEEVGIVNGTYVGPFFSDLHTFALADGQKCCGTIASGGVFGLHAGHDPAGKDEWTALPGWE